MSTDAKRLLPSLRLQTACLTGLSHNPPTWLNDGSLYCSFAVHSSQLKLKAWRYPFSTRATCPAPHKIPDFRLALRTCKPPTVALCVGGPVWHCASENTCASCSSDCGLFHPVFSEPLPPAKRSLVTEFPFLCLKGTLAGEHGSRDCRAEFTVRLRVRLRLVQDKRLVEKTRAATLTRIKAC